MSFMQEQVQFGEWYEVDGAAGTEFVQYDLVGDFWPFPNVRELELGGSVPIPDELSDYCESRTCCSIKLRQGWGARLSAPGYLDCTEWSVFDSEQEARDYLTENYGDEQEEQSEDEPDDDAITTEDHIRWFQYGKLVLTTADRNDPYSPADDCLAQVKAHMDRQRFWPNAWFISDHGNAHLLSL